MSWTTGKFGKDLYAFGTCCTYKEKGRGDSIPMSRRLNVDKTELVGIMSGKAIRKAIKKCPGSISDGSVLRTRISEPFVES